MKKLLSLFSIGALLSLLVVACSNSDNRLLIRINQPKIGVAISNLNDPFLSEVKTAITDEARGKLKVDIVDCQDSQPIQNDNIDQFLSKKYDVIAINLVDRTAASHLIERAKEENVPVIFFNNKPEGTDLQKYDKAYYVGTLPEQSPSLEGEIVVDYSKAHPEADKNKDGIIQYVMLTGTPKEQDTELRTKFSVDAIENWGLKVQKIAEDTAMWDRKKAETKMSSILSTQVNKIEAVIANNDDMALGVIDALKAKGYFNGTKYIPVVGIDGTGEALQAIKTGTLLGTVLNDGKSQGKAISQLAISLAKKKIPSQDNMDFEMTDGKYIWIPFKKITRDNLDEAE
ncbi:galactose ABC transporter substrate-binding protein [Bacillus sp. RG28]|uniref:D-galactose/methyl-galactoside binding periplasmic protein MglB n=1 Tax=Gottfriedia endophytica TaxID=2820819 RepID=A0A940NS56_9BACI|nr:galactose ABC transporter substrate-binding protein [Gottfriedia endophytica]MBP0725831.1 galactose ABC transporter substrate-binding protein [Gottfriedia endophytica]